MARTITYASTDNRVLRGGAFLSLASFVRSSYRYSDFVLTNRNIHDGVRIIRIRKDVKNGK